MPRGHYWEQSYAPNVHNPTETLSLQEALRPCGGIHGKVIRAEAVCTVKVTSKEPPRIIECCDFEVSVADSQLTNIKFIKCRFVRGTWKTCKFSSCTFEHCDFDAVQFEDCYFLTSCEFRKNSASPELFKLNRTAIPPAAFLGSLEPNLEYLPEDVSVDYQQFRFLSTKRKLAKLIWSSNEDEAELDYFYEAQAQLVLTVLSAKVAKCRYRENRSGVQPCSLFAFIVKSTPWRLELWLVKASGFITKWGQSVIRPMAVFLLLVAIFTGLWYVLLRHMGQPHSIVSVFGRALNLTLAVGYTIHIGERTAPVLKALAIANVALGLWWYSLIVPVLLKRTIR